VGWACIRALAGLVPTEIGLLGQLTQLSLVPNHALAGTFVRSIETLLVADWEHEESHVVWRMQHENECVLAGPLPTQFGQLAQLKELRTLLGGACTYWSTVVAPTACPLAGWHQSAVPVVALE
jgi:hypothetical protein